MLTVGSLFAGIGGFDLGLERAGMRVIWQSEIDPYASAVLRKHWPDVPNHGDIRSIRAGTVERPDVICGGFPCQPFSHAGKQRGAADDRHLWPEMCRVVDELRPTWVIGENVAGIIRMELDAVLSDLEALGYATRTFVIPAASVDAPHRRDRVWIVARNAYGNGEPVVPVDAEVAELRGDVADAEYWQLSLGRDVAGARWEREQVAQWAGSDEKDSTERMGMDDGVSARMDRLRCLGNAVVPQVVEVIGRAIVAEHGRCS